MERILSMFLLVFCTDVFSMLAPGASMQVEAAFVTYEFTGTISEVTGSVHTPSGTGANGFNSGMNLSGRYTFDTTARHMNPPPPPGGAGSSSQQGYYPDSLRAFDFTIGTYATGPQTAGGSSVILGDLGARYRVDMA